MKSLATMVCLTLALITAPAHPGEGLGSADSPRVDTARAAKRPFVVFAPMRWRPGAPLPGEWQENVAYGLFVAAPLVSLGLLAIFIRRAKRSKAPTGWGRLVLGNTLVLCCLATPILLAEETYFRFFYDTTDSLETPSRQVTASATWQIGSRICCDGRIQTGRFMCWPRSGWTRTPR